MADNNEFDEETEGGTMVAMRVEDIQSAAKDQGQLRAYLIVIAGENVGEMYRVSDQVIIGRAQNAEVRVLDDGVSRKHAMVAVKGGDVFVSDLGSTNGTFVNGEKVANQPLKDGDKIEVGETTILKFTLHDQVEEQFHQNMFEAALRDGLTKIYNKRYFEGRLQTEVAFSLRHGSMLSLILFDIDFFKKINDTYGHLGGDAVLSTLAQRVQFSIRKEDIAARYGGEEFALICRGLDIYKTQAFAERIRSIIEKTEFKFEDKVIPVTISCGVAAMPDSRVHAVNDIIALADEALYRAKREGRNRVMINPAPSV